MGAGTSIWVWIADQLCCRVLWSFRFVGRDLGFSLAPVPVHGLPCRSSDGFGMDVEHKAGVPTRLFIPSQPQDLASLVFELPGWPQKPFINQQNRFWQGFGGYV